MPSIGFFELLVIVVVAVLALKPEQIAGAVKSLRRHLIKFRQVTSKLERDILYEEKELELQQRIEAASKVSDVSDLLPGPSDDNRKSS